MGFDDQNNGSNRFRENRYNNTDIHQYPSRRAARQTARPAKKKHKKALFVLAIIAIFLAVFGVKKWYSAKNAINSIFDSANIQKSRNVSADLKNGKPVSILLLGTDTGALGRNYRGRTDTMIVATLNPKKKKMTLTSIPRDTVMSFPGYEQYSPSKINSAYAFGGAGTAIKSVEKLLNVPIDYYGLINMGGLEKIVDGVGGVDVTPKLTFKYGHANVKKGVKTHLNGKEALDYSRMRHDDPKGDYGRQTRQRQIIMAILQKSDSITALLNSKFLKSIKTETKTDLTFEELLTISANYRVATHHLKSTHLQGTSKDINGGSYEYPSVDERQRVTNFIRKALELKHKTTGTTGLDSSITGETEDSTATTSSDNTTVDNSQQYSSTTSDTYGTGTYSDQTTNAAPATSAPAVAGQY